MLNCHLNYATMPIYSSLQLNLTYTLLSHGKTNTALSNR